MSTEESVYRPPQSALELPVPNRGSIEAALAGNYELRIGEILGEAWRLVKGSKGAIIGGAALMYAIAIGASILGTIVQQLGDHSGGAILLAFLIQMSGSLLTYPLVAGVLLYAIRRAAGNPAASFSDITGCYRRPWPIIGLNLLGGVFILLGFLLLILPGIYLSVAYFLAAPLLVERELGVWESLETSRKALTHKWFHMFGLALVTGLIVLFGALLTLGIGLIWLIPFAFLVYGVAYRNIFGVREDQPGAPLETQSV